MTCTGLGVSLSVRLISEPVITTVCKLSESDLPAVLEASWALTMPLLSAPTTAAPMMKRTVRLTVRGNERLEQVSLDVIDCITFLNFPFRNSLTLGATLRAQAQ